MIAVLVVAAGVDVDENFPQQQQRPHQPEEAKKKKNRMDAAEKRGMPF